MAVLPYPSEQALRSKCRLVLRAPPAQQSFGFTPACKMTSLGLSIPRGPIVVRALLSRDVAPGFAGADRTGIKGSLVRHLRVCSCGMRYDLRVLPRGATLPQPITITITVEFDGFATADGTISSG